MTKSVKIILTALISIGWLTNSIWLVVAFIYTPFIFLTIPHLIQGDSDAKLFYIIMEMGWLVNILVLFYPILFIRVSNKPRSAEADVIFTVTIFAPLFLLAAYKNVGASYSLKNLTPIISYSLFFIANIILRQSWKNE